MKKIELLIFDLDGTSVDTCRDLANLVNFALNALNLPPLQIEKIISYVGNGLTKLLNRSLPQDRLEKVVDIFPSHDREHLLDFLSFTPLLKMF